MWNNLPKSLKVLQGNKETFKRKLKKHTKHLSNITFSKGSINNHNKEEDFYYYSFFFFFLIFHFRLVLLGMAGPRQLYSCPFIRPALPNKCKSAILLAERQSVNSQTDWHMDYTVGDALTQ